MATQTVIQEQRLPGFQEEFLKDIFAQAKALRETPQPFAKEQMAGLSPQQMQAIQAAQQGIGAYQPFLDRAQEYAAPGGVTQFMNPFENQVVQQTMQDIATQGQKAQQQLAGSGVASGAFGGSRFGVAQADLAGKTLEQQARSAGQIRQQGFQQAQQAAQQAARLQAGLGQAAQQMGSQDVRSLLGIGGLTQQMGYTDPTTGQVFQGQADLDMQRRNLLAQQALPFQQIGFLSDIFRGVPALNQTFTTRQAPQPNMLTTGIGLLGAGLSGGLFNNMLGA